MNTDRHVRLGDGTIVSFLCINGTHYIDGEMVDSHVQDQYYNALCASPRLVSKGELITREDYQMVIDYWEHKRLDNNTKIFRSSDEFHMESARCHYIQSLVEEARLVNLKY